MANVQNKYSKKQDTLLHLEIVAASDDAYMSQNAVYQIATLHINEKRFTEAHLVLNKAEELDMKSKRLTYLKDFV